MFCKSILQTVGSRNVTNLMTCMRSSAKCCKFRVSRRLCCVSPSISLLNVSKEDRFNCIHVDVGNIDHLKCEAVGSDAFSQCLSESVSQWQAEGRAAVWLKLPAEQGRLIPLAARHGFELHHAQDGHVVMSRWLRTDASRLPRYASHQVGVAGFVLNEDTEEVLMVQDKHRLVRWKFPGGLSNPGEDIQDTAMREVMEETGLQTEFKSILAFRQSHNQPGAFGCSDIYVVCRLAPLTFDLRLCPAELEDARWMGVGDVAAADPGGHTPLSRRMSQLVLRGLTEGFGRVDIAIDELPSVYNTTYKLFHRPLAS